MYNKIKATGINEIKGQIYIVNPYYHGRKTPINMSSTDKKFYYGAKVDAFNLDENYFSLNLSSTGNKFIVKFNDKTLDQLIHFDNKLYAANKDELNFCQLNVKATQPNKLLLDGCLGQGNYKLRFSVPSTEYIVKKKITLQLNKLKIMVHSHKITTLKKHPINTILLVTDKSAELDVLLKHMIQVSDNLYAQTLTKMLGYSVYNHGTFAAGTKAIQHILKQQLNANYLAVQFEDGAGSSENDLLTAQFLTQLLYVIQKEPIFKSFYNSLPVGGISGTLANRFKNILKGKVIAKTGSMATVRKLTGYLIIDNMNKYIFSIMINGLKENQKTNAMNFEQQLLTKLFNMGKVDNKLIDQGE